MCGLVGIHTGESLGFYKKEAEILQGMLVVNSLRGRHSTGLAGFSRFERDKAQVSLVKSIGSPYTLLDRPHVDVFFDRMVQSMGTIIGHGRYATHGDITADNAHPFEEGNIVLAHNGGISNFLSLKEKGLDEHIQVDSQQVARLFDRHGADNVLPELRGAYSLMWYDKTDGALHLARNDKRPMFFASVKGKKHVLFASEEQTIQWAADRWNLELDTIFTLLPMHHIKFDKNNHIYESVNSYKEKPIITSFPVPVKTTIETKVTQLPKGRLTKRERRQQRANERNQVADKIKTQLASDEETAQSGLIVGGKITVTVWDTYNIQDKEQKLLVKAEASDFPNVEFRFQIPMEQEHAFIMSDYVEVTVGVILVPSNNEATLNNAEFVCFVKDPKPIQTKEEIVLDTDLLGYNEHVSITDREGDKVFLSPHRLEELAKNGCCWCGDDITKDQLSQPDLLLYEDTIQGFPAGVTCPHCAFNWRSSSCHLPH